MSEPARTRRALIPVLAAPGATDSRASSMTLAEFLLARIAEDEDAANEAVGSHWRASSTDDGESYILNERDNWIISAEEVDADHIVRWDPARVLAECDAKRRIVTHWRLIESGALIVGTNHPEYRSALFFAARVLATPYADHDDFQEEWRV